MNSTTLHASLVDPTNLKGSDIQELKQLLDQYPYMQAIRSLYLKALYSNESTAYNQELKKTAAYTLDRDILFSFIISDDFSAYQPLPTLEEESTLDPAFTPEKPKESEQNISTLLQNLSKVAYSITQDEKPQEQTTKEEPVDVPAFNSNSDEKLEQLTEKEETPRRSVTVIELLENKLEIGKPLAFNESEKYSFQEWLKLSKQQPISRELDTNKEDLPEINEPEAPIITEDEKKLQESLEKKQAIIDKFIETNPKITPTKKNTASPINVELSVQENTSLMTETLAKIYLEQKKYQKAIQAYEILILKYPEKSSFFANQILDIKALQQHNSL